MEKEERLESCSCKCHFGGAVSCPGCIKNHEESIHCEHCMKN
jgi:hypothetical protein